MKPGIPEKKSTFNFLSFHHKVQKMHYLAELSTEKYLLLPSELMEFSCLVHWDNSHCN